MKNWYQFFTDVCEILVPILHVSEILLPVLHTCEELVPIHLMCEESVPILHTSEIINLWNLSTDFRPQNLSILTIRKSHILQIWCICTSSSNECEICEVWNLRFNKACYFVFTRKSIDYLYCSNVFRKLRDWTIRVAETKALISLGVTAKLICVFVFAYPKSRFSHIKVERKGVFVTRTCFRDGKLRLSSY